jgi:hypothetical protein
MRFPLLLALALLTGCAREAWHAPQALPDTTYLPAGTDIGKLKAKTVIIQAGTGNVATPIDNTQAGKKADAAAIGAGSSAAATTPAGVPWWVYALLVALGVGGGLWLRSRLPI